MKTLFSRHKWLQIVFGVLMLAAGAAVIGLSLEGSQDMSVWLSVLSAIVLFIFGISIIFSGVFSLDKKYFSSVFLYASIAIALGVVLCLHTDFIGVCLTQFTASLILAVATIQLGKATAMIFFKKPKPTIIMFFVLGALLIAAGIVIFVVPDVNEFINKVIYVIAGGVFAIVGICQIIWGVYATIHAVRMSKLETPVDQIEETKPIETIPNEEIKKDNNPQA